MSLWYFMSFPCPIVCHECCNQIIPKKNTFYFRNWTPMLPTLKQKSVTSGILRNDQYVRIMKTKQWWKSLPFKFILQINQVAEVKSRLISYFIRKKKDIWLLVAFILHKFRKCAGLVWVNMDVYNADTCIRNSVFT